MQLLMGMSMSRYLPATGTAGLLRNLVRGYSRVPRPPPRMRLRTSCMGRLAGPLSGGGVGSSLRPCYHSRAARWEEVFSGRPGASGRPVGGLRVSVVEPAGHAPGQQAGLLDAVVERHSA